MYYIYQGYHSLEDLEKAGVLNRVQKVGLKHYHDFVERMQREEVAEIEAKVRGSISQLVLAVSSFHHFNHCV